MNSYIALPTADVTPRASALLESLRDIGYSLETALADVIDNSLTAGAKNIEIFADTLSNEPSISIRDDGTGMDRQSLIEAMRPGSRNPREEREPTDLGRFGLGLKSASFSQCRRLTVWSRHEKHVKIGLSNGYVETHKLNSEPDILDANRSAARHLIAGLNPAGFDLSADDRPRGGFLFKNVDVQLVDEFLIRFRNARESIGTTIDPLRRYVGDRAQDELKNWDVFIPSVGDGKPENLSSISGTLPGSLCSN